MLAAIVPSGEKLWFFKLVGPPEKVAAVKQDVDAVFASIHPDNEAEGKLAWQTPKGWEQLPPSDMREATLVSPADAGSLELTVIPLGASGDLEADVLSNVNRWLGQLGQPPATPQQLEKITTPLKAVPGAVSVDLAGEFAAGGMTPPMAARPAAPPANAPAKDAVDSAFKSETPAGWTRLPDRAMRIATYQAGDAEVVVSQFAAFGQMGDALENVNRWRGQVGLPPASEEELDDLAVDVEIAGEPGRYFDVIAADQPIGMLAAMSVRGEQVWFFKLTGPSKTAQSQQGAFRDWLGTIEITD
ncbi:hypothetical protein Pla175_20490 [Pirellulimonas nuda]|uniref:Uncharacterized protein n=2 Tax=Pirellulimonas nuda TaxID=2528009 RepID=A0A518DB11_9BACT|nr:hypothetical protein Pla175_20490 [Pirellulimonas nuda]